MRFSKETLLVALAAGTFGVAGSAGAATVLDFVTGNNNGDGMPAGYGSNAAGTPNVALAYSDDWDGYDNGWDGRGEVGQWDAGVDAVATIDFTADAGFGTFVTSFELDEFSGGGDTVVSWELLGTGFSGTVTALGNTDNPGDDVRRFTVNTGMTAGDAVAGTLTLQLTRDSGASSYQAMDNLAFDQVVVPEPGSGVLALGGLGALAMRRKRK